MEYEFLEVVKAVVLASFDHTSLAEEMHDDELHFLVAETDTGHLCVQAADWDNNVLETVFVEFR